MNALFSSLIATVLISLVSLVGIFTIRIKEKRLQNMLLPMIAFAAGALFGDAFLHILPESFAATSGPTQASLLILCGIVSFFMVEKLLNWRHCHHLPDKSSHLHPVGTLNLIGDAIHNFIDGAIIASSFLVSFPLGLATSIAVLLHEIPQEIGDYATLLHAGYSKTRALKLNFLTALSAVLGVVIIFVLPISAASLSSILLPFAAGSFIYIAGSDLVPFLHQKNEIEHSAKQLFFLLLGILIMYALLLLN